MSVSRFCLTIAAILALVITSPVMYAQDDCATAAAVGEGTHAYDTSGGTTSGPTDCDTNMSNDTWFLYTASANGVATAGTCAQSGSDGDSVLCVYDASAGCPTAGDTGLASSDDACGASGYMSQTSFAVTGGSSYYIQLGGWNGPGGTGDLQIDLAAATPGDACADAIAVGEGTHAYDTTSTVSDGPTDCDSNMSNDTWFLYTASSSGTVTVGTCSQSGTNNDSVMIVYDAAGGCPTTGAACLVSNDDGCGASTWMSTADFNACAGASYYIQIGGWNGPGGTGDLDITMGAPLVEDCTNGIDDDCDGMADCMDSDCSNSCICATAVGEGTHAYDTSGGSTDGPTDCDSNMSNDTWFLYTPSADGVATFGTCAQTGTDGDSVLCVYDASAGCPTAGDTGLASSDDACGASGYMSETSIAVSAASTYYIQLGGWNGPGGTGDLQIDLDAPTPGDACADAIAVGEGTHAYDTTDTVSDGPNDCDSNMSNDTWFLYTASSSGTVTVGTCSQSGTNNDSVMIVYDAAGGCPTAGDACLVSNDDGCGASTWMSTADFDACAGSSYYIQIGGWNGPGGTGDLDITMGAPLVEDCLNGTDDDCDGLADCDDSDCDAQPECTPDFCSGAAAVGEGTHAYDTSGGTTSGPTDCDTNMSNDTWFLYTASADGNATIGTCAQTGTDGDSVLCVYDASAGCPTAGDTGLASSDDACGASGYMSEVTMAVSGGSSYYIQLGGWNGPGGTGDLQIDLASAPPGDACANAVAVGEGTHAYDTTNTASDGPNDCDSNMSNDMWFLYTASSSGTVTVGTCSQSGTNNDSVLIVYDAAGGCPTAGDACIVSNDDGCGASTWMSTADFDACAGSTYYIQLGGWNGPGGTGDLDITMGAPLVEDCLDGLDNDCDGLVDCDDSDCDAQPECTPDFCSGAAEVGEGTHAYDTSGGTTSGPTDCDTNMSNDTWFLYTASAAGTATIGTCSQSGSNNDSVLCVYDASAGCPTTGDTGLASSDDACGASSWMSVVSIAVSAGGQYYVQLGGWNGPGGTGDLDISLTPPDSACNAIPMDVGANAFDTTGFPGTGTAPAGCTNSYGNNAADGWYSYTPAAGGIVDIDTCDGSSFDTDLAFYSGDCSAPVLIACDGDGGAGAAGGCQNFSSELAGLVVNGGETYLINVGGWGAGNEGPGTVNITFTPLAPEDCLVAGDEDGNGLADCADPACAAEPQCQEAGNCDDFVDNDLDGDVDCADADCAADAACAGCPTSLSQNVDPDNVTAALVACAYSDGASAGNAYARSWDTSIYDCPDGIRVTGIRFGVGAITNADDTVGQTWTVSVWLDGNGGIPDAGMELISSEDVTIFEADSNTVKEVTLATPAALYGGATLVAGVTVGDEGGTGNFGRPGRNDAGESAPTYLDAPLCGLAWGPLSNIGFGDHHIVLTLITDDQGAGMGGDECASALSVSEGANLFDANAATNGADAVPAAGDCVGGGLGGFNNDMWFTYTAATAGEVTVDTCYVGSYDTDIAAYTDCPDSGGTLITCNGDAPDAGSGAGGACQTWYSSMNVGVMAAGDSIRIRVGAYSPGAGIGSLNITNIPPLPTINEVRIDNPGTDTDEYFELAGLPQDLTGLSYIVIGDGAGGSGTIESVTDLSGQALGAGGFWWAGEASATLGTPDMTATLGFENSDNVTHMLVSDFTGVSGDDLDTDDDGIFDSEPWSAVVDSVALVENFDIPASGEHIYSATTVGPDGTFVPGHIERCPDGNGDWKIAEFDHTLGSDTPGASNSCLAPPANDECADAFVASVGVTDIYNINATDSADPWDPAPCTGGDMLADIWYSFTAPEDGTASFSTCDPGSWDTDLSINTGACGALTQIACSGDAGDGTGNGGACQAWYSEITGLAVTGGETYYVRIGGWSAADQGVGTMTIGFAPAGDEPCDAVEAFDGTTIVDNNNASDSTVPSGADAESLCTGTFLGQFNQDMWYSYTATCDGTLRIDTCDEAGFDTDLALYDVDCASVDQPIACSGDSSALPGPCQSFYSGIEIATTTGSTYLIRVGGWNDAAFGTVEMHIECEPDADPPVASFTVSGSLPLSMNFQNVTLNDTSNDGGDATATVTIDWGDGTPSDSGAAGDSFIHLYAVDLGDGTTLPTGFEATPSVTITNIVGTDTVTGDTIRVIPIGDTNNDLDANIADMAYLLTWLFAGGPPMDCYQAGDLNGDDVSNLADAVYALYFLFVPGSDAPIIPASPLCD
ncbi:MAG: hypothetical protein VX764_05720 [Planctomycetota bacterium]|nr:hypothetical protein [Planctomycetota bacterium]